MLHFIRLDDDNGNIKEKSKCMMNVKREKQLWKCFDFFFTILGFISRFTLDNNSSLYQKPSSRPKHPIQQILWCTASVNEIKE